MLPLFVSVEGYLICILARVLSHLLSQVLSILSAQLQTQQETIKTSLPIYITAKVAVHSIAQSIAFCHAVGRYAPDVLPTSQRNTSR